MDQFFFSLQSFMKRHHTLSLRTPERVSRARAEVTEQSIRTWFGDLITNVMELDAMDIFDDPSRIFNSDETCVQLCPKSGKVIGIRGSKNVYEIAPGTEKSNLTFLATVSADGKLIAPLIIYPYQRVPKDIVQSVPDDFFIGTSETGWMRAETFFEFVANPFNNWLETHGINKPVILFVDGHRAHLSLQVSKFCDENGIILYLLPPNTTHIMQPADVSLFKPFKTFWRDEVLQFQRENPNNVVRRRNVAPLIGKVLRRITPVTIINGFRKSGIFPLNPDAVDYGKCLEIDVRDDTDEETEELQESNAVTQEQYRIALQVLETELSLESIQMHLDNNTDVAALYRSIQKKSDPRSASFNHAHSSHSITTRTAKINTVNERNSTPEIIMQMEDSSQIISNTPTVSPENATVSTNDASIVYVQCEGVPLQPSFEKAAPETSATYDELTGSPQDLSLDPSSFILENSSELLCHMTHTNEISLKRRNITLNKDDSLLTQHESPSYQHNTQLSLYEGPSNQHDPPLNQKDAFQRSNEQPINNDFQALSCQTSRQRERKPLQAYNYFTGKIKYKKKEPTERIMNVVSSKGYRELVENRAARGKAKRSNDWTCKFCHSSFKSEKKSKKVSTWIECDSCKSQMHVKCIPREHMTNGGYSESDFTGETSFECEMCFQMSD